MPAQSAYLEHLATLPLFSSCSKRELQKIARAGDEVSVEAGRVLVDQGDIGREAFVILEGTAVVKRNGRRIAMLGPGDHFGELSLLDHGPRTATVVTDTDTNVLVLGSRQFAGVLDEVPTMARKLMAALASRVRELDSKAFG
jgi:CRP-like cAMP-binding protein